MQADFEAQGQDIWGAKILLLPTVIMNQNQYRGRLDTPSIVRGLCSGFKENSDPEASLLNLGSEDWPMKHALCLQNIFYEHFLAATTCIQ